MLAKDSAEALIFFVDHAFHFAIVHRRRIYPGCRYRPGPFDDHNRRTLREFHGAGYKVQRRPNDQLSMTSHANASREGLRKYLITMSAVPLLFGANSR